MSATNRSSDRRQTWRRFETAGKRQAPPPTHASRRNLAALAPQEQARQSSPADGPASAADQQRGPVSRKQRRALRPRVIDLKLQVRWPSVVEPWDGAAPEPYELVRIKCERFTVPVPAHWRSKRKYLENKRGLPSATVAYVRDAHQQLLRYNEALMETEPSSIALPYLWSRLRAHGDVYSALSEFDPLRGCSFRPGVISTALAEALNWSSSGSYTIHECPWREGWILEGKRSPPSYPAMGDPTFRWRILPGQAGCLHRTLDQMGKRRLWGHMQQQ
jgi:hypothetical protein